MSNTYAIKKGESNLNLNFDQVWAGLFNPWLAGRMQPSTALSVTQHKIINFFKTLRFICRNIFIPFFEIWMYICTMREAFFKNKIHLKIILQAQLYKIKEKIMMLLLKILLLLIFSFSKIFIISVIYMLQH